MMKFSTALVALALAALPLRAASLEWEPPALDDDSPERPNLDVHYVPTPPEVVEVMLDLAQVGEEDVVYDLGCGDGRIVIAAVRDRGAKSGVGIDLDPERIAESIVNAREAGVDDRVRFARQDLFESDFSDATVIALYLLPSLNERLKPKLYAELPPGTRVVSHDFGMGSWQPDRLEKVKIGRTHYVNHWIIPANVSGVWEVEAETSNGTKSLTLEIRQSFQELDTSAVSGGNPIPLSASSLQGDRLELDFEDEKPMRFTGNANGDTITGTITLIAEDGEESEAGSWTARRVEGSEGEILRAASVTED